jgi:hypothetical protein
VLRSDHLKTFDVLCLDTRGTVSERYDAFVDFPFFRFKSGRTEDYLKGLAPPMPQGGTRAPVSYDKLEGTHRAFFE